MSFQKKGHMFDGLRNKTRHSCLPVLCVNNPGGGRVRPGGIRSGQCVVVSFGQCVAVSFGQCVAVSFGQCVAVSFAHCHDSSRGGGLR